MSRAVREAETRPTERREGDDIPPTRVQCYACWREGITEMEINLCGCGRWFEVVRDGE